MDPAKVSVIIPVYNTESYLPECIESLLNQTYPFFEIICVDDGSTDRSAQIIEAYAAEDPRVTLIRQQNSFAGTARNRGMDQAQGKYLLFLDSDDYFDPRMLELSVSRAEETAADIVVFGGYNLDSRTNTAKVRPSYLKEHLVSGLEVFSRKDIPDHILTLSNPAPWNKLYRRDFVKARDLSFMSTRSANDVYFTKMAFVLADRISCTRARSKPTSNSGLGLAQVGKSPSGAICSATQKSFARPSRPRASGTRTAPAPLKGV